MATFPHSSLWGAATAMYQAEGEHDADGEGPSIWDIYSYLPGTAFEDTTGDVAVGHYHRFRKDVALMTEMGLQSYRFSISWPRLPPVGHGEVNEAGTQLYGDLVDKLLAYNIEPMITFYHWDLPQALQDEGDWEACTTVEVFAGYARLCYAHSDSRAKLWVTSNETTVFIGHGYISDLHPLVVRGLIRVIQACHRVFIACALTVRVLREVNVAGEIGFVNMLQPHTPLTDSEVDKKAIELADVIHTHWLYDPVLKGTYPAALLVQTQALWGIPRFAPDDGILLHENHCDLIRLNYYRRETVSVQSSNISTGDEPGVEELLYFVRNPRSTYTEWGWEVQPQGLTDGITMVREYYDDVPICIIENGLGAKDPIIAGEVANDPRVGYLSSHTGTLEKALALGADVRGYYPWSPIDLLSWFNGYQRQYGFVYADHRQNPVRKRKGSFHWYKSAIASHDGQRQSSPAGATRRPAWFQNILELLPALQGRLSPLVMGLYNLNYSTRPHPEGAVG